MKTSAIASFSADDPAATFNCKLDNGEFEPCKLNVQKKYDEILERVY